jgi:UDP-N-acetylmuramyl tripeptide synthase
LLTATEVNEWAWVAAGRASGAFDDPLHAPGHPAAWDEAQAAATLTAQSLAERSPRLVALESACRERDLPLLVDDDAVSIGIGKGCATWPRDRLPTVADVPWPRLGRIPVALVTGTNGKTTTVRLLAALLRSEGRRVAHSCTDGLWIDGSQIEAGDWSGPGGARVLLRRPEVEAAVLETARGGILRRGLAIDRADVAVLTNVSADHVGEYGVHTLDDIAETKLTLARAVPPPAWLVLNAGDARLRERGLALDRRRAWFALDPAAVPEADAPRCVLDRGHLLLRGPAFDADLGDVRAMPISADGRARWNVENLAAAALAAWLMGLAPGRIAAGLARFGRDRGDNPGRLQRWNRGGVDVFLDYAHNPAGLAGLLEVARAGLAGGRLGLLLGHAGNRGDDELRALAATAARFLPARIVLKDTPAYFRGRAPGEVPAVLRAELRRLGLPEAALEAAPDELAGATALLDWARPGDVVVLPVLDRAVREALAGRLSDR